jgi:hypothetical protein
MICIHFLEVSEFLTFVDFSFYFHPIIQTYSLICRIENAFIEVFCLAFAEHYCPVIIFVVF